MFESFCKPPWSTQYISIVFEDGKVYQTAISSTRFGTDESQNNLFTTWALIVTQEQMLVVCRFGRQRVWFTEGIEFCGRKTQKDYNIVFLPKWPQCINVLHYKKKSTLQHVYFLKADVFTCILHLWFIFLLHEDNQKPT